MGHVLGLARLARGGSEGEWQHLLHWVLDLLPGLRGMGSFSFRLLLLLLLLLPRIGLIRRGVCRLIDHWDGLRSPLWAKHARIIHVRL